MAKYSTPPVTLRDVLAALPKVLPPLAWRVSVYPSSGGPDSAQVAVELVVNRANGSTMVWKRWGRSVRTNTPLTGWQGALLSAQEAYVFCEGKDPVELRKLVLWEHDML